MPEMKASNAYIAYMRERGEECMQYRSLHVSLFLWHRSAQYNGHCTVLWPHIAIRLSFHYNYIGGVLSMTYVMMCACAITPTIWRPNLWCVFVLWYCWPGSPGPQLCRSCRKERCRNNVVSEIYADHRSELQKLRCVGRRPATVWTSTQTFKHTDTNQMRSHQDRK